MQLISKNINNLKDKHIFRNLEIMSGLDFSSNDYLGLSNNEFIKMKLSEHLLNGCALGSTGSRLISGENSIYKETEAFIANLYEAESALIFGSGYLANIGVLTALGGEDTCFFSDELNHASLIDGIKLSKSHYKIFAHNDILQLEDHLLRSSFKRKVIVTESIFSMDGDKSPLIEIIELAKKHDAFVVLDEAHATGVLGGRGLGESENNLQNYHKLVAVHTCSKALGAYGAYVLSNKLIRDLLINCSRSFIYSTGLPPISVLNIRLSLEEIIKSPDLHLKLNENSNYLQKKLGINSSSNILPFIIGNDVLVMRASEKMIKAGFQIRGIRFPSVPKGMERLRITVKSFHQKDQLNQFADTLKDVLNDL